MPNGRDTLEEYYAIRASEYDRVYTRPERQADLRAIETWLPELFKDRSVLEVACGTGYWTQFMAPVASCVLAVDAVPEMLDIARNRVPEESVRFLIGDAYALPPIEPGFEAGFAGFWLSHVPRSRVREFLLGFHSGLKHDAKVVLLDNRFVEGSSTPISDHDAEGNTYQDRLLSDGTMHRVLKNFPSEAELRALVRDIGRNIKYRKWQYYWALEYVAIDR